LPLTWPLNPIKLNFCHFIPYTNYTFEKRQVGKIYMHPHGDKYMVLEIAGTYQMP
jgi:hypothetical protein